MKKLVVLCLCLASFLGGFAQENKSLDDFDYVVRRVENDYPGYADKVNDSNAKEIIKLKNSLRSKVMEFPDSCYVCLREYLAWFNDYHLRISYASDYDWGEQPVGDKKFGQFNEHTLQNSSDPYEGIWIGFSGSFALQETESGKYQAISIDFSGYSENQIIFEGSVGDDNKLDLISYKTYNLYRPTKGCGSLHLEGAVLEIHDDTRFVRKTDNPSADMAFLRSYRAEFPNGRNTYPLAMSMGDSTFYLRIPNFHSSTGNDLIVQHWDEIMTRPNLIVDIRNNGGGQDNYYQKLAELIYTNPYESKGVEWFASDGHISDLEDAIKTGKIKDGFEEQAKKLLAKMQSNRGGYVLHPLYGHDIVVERDTVYNYPKRVGVIINEGNASSAEQFLLAAKESSKVTLFGNENTAGVLDYSNITPRETPSGKYSLWLPGTRSRRLPENPIDNIGIAPDVHVPFQPTPQLYNRLDDWVYFVKCYLEY